MIWRSIVVASSLALALVFIFVFHGGTTVFVFLLVWAAIWLAFSLLWRRADDARRVLMRPPSS